MSDPTEPAGITDRGDFARALTRLRERAGRSVRDLAREVDQQPSTLGGYFSGRHLPPVTATEAFTAVLTACGVPAEELPDWLDALVRVRHAPGHTGPDASPYRGLESFRPEDADWFFGREALTATLVEELRHANAGSGLVAVVGASGSGKSSLLRAGLVPAVQRGELNCPDRPRDWRVITPGPDPVAELERALDGSGPCRLLVVDQFEELFTVCGDDRRRKEFVSRLQQECGAGTGTVAALGLRADFYAETTRLRGMVDVLQRHQVVVGPMDEAGLRQAIEEPARRSGVVLEDGFTDVLLQALAPVGPAGPDGAPEPGVLPLLSHALLATWERSRRGRLTVADYLAAGEVRGAIATTAEDIHTRLSPPERAAARQLFRRLVSPGAGVADTRRRVRHAELATDGTGPSPELTAAIEAYVRGRLLTADDESVQISHEALVPAWPRLREWIDADRAGLRLQHEISEASAGWRAAGRDPHLLYRAAR
ncbi:MAG: helix-turn-helix domain-containing protein [Kineosporiaceae bacterium]